MEKTREHARRVEKSVEHERTGEHLPSSAVSSSSSSSCRSSLEQSVNLIDEDDARCESTSNLKNGLDEL